MGFMLKNQDKSSLELVQMDNDSLESLRKEMPELIGECADSLAFSKTALGKHRIARIERDLVSIQRKYYSISGSMEESALELARNQGRERATREELNLFKGAEETSSTLHAQVEQIDQILAERKKIQSGMR